VSAAMKSCSRAYCSTSFPGTFNQLKSPSTLFVSPSIRLFEPLDMIVTLFSFEPFTAYLRKKSELKTTRP
jgi:hypothetical protein